MPHTKENGIHLFVFILFLEPNPASSIALLVDATNLTIQFPRPEGLIDYYSVEYILLKSPIDHNQTTLSNYWATLVASMTNNGLSSSIGSKNFTDTGLSISSETIIKLSLDDLISGAGYILRIRTCSHFMYSDPVHLEAYTSKKLNFKIKIIIIIINSSIRIISNFFYLPSNNFMS